MKGGDAMKMDSIEIPQPISDAIRDGEAGLAAEGLKNLIEGIQDSLIAQEELDRPKRRATIFFECLRTLAEDEKSNPGESEAWLTLRRKCGWNPDDHAEVKAAGPMVMRVEDLRKGDEIVVGRNHVPRFDSFDCDGHLQVGVIGYMRRAVAESLFKRGVEVYRTIDGVRTLISGWPVGEHPAEAENRRLREENEALRFERDKGFDRKFQNTLAGVEVRQAENERLKNELEAANSKLAAWQAAANHDPDPNPLLPGEPPVRYDSPEELIERIKAFFRWGSTSDKRIRELDAQIATLKAKDDAWLKAANFNRGEALPDSLAVAEPKDLAIRLSDMMDGADEHRGEIDDWRGAANYNPNGTPLAEPITRPTYLVARLDGMVEASRSLESQLANRKVCINRVAVTLHAYCTGQLSRKCSPSFTRAANLVVLAIESLFNTGDLPAKPYEISTNFWGEPK